MSIYSINRIIDFIYVIPTKGSYEFRPFGNIDASLWLAIYMLGFVLFNGSTVCADIRLSFVCVFVCVKVRTTSLHNRIVECSRKCVALVIT